MTFKYHDGSCKVHEYCWSQHFSFKLHYRFRRTSRIEPMSTACNFRRTEQCSLVVRRVAMYTSGRSAHTSNCSLSYFHKLQINDWWKLIQKIRTRQLLSTYFSSQSAQVNKDRSLHLFQRLIAPEYVDRVKQMSWSFDSRLLAVTANDRHVQEVCYSCRTSSSAAPLLYPRLFKKKGVFHWQIRFRP